MSRFIDFVYFHFFFIFFFWQTNELVMSLEDDEKLILQNGQTLRDAGVGKN